jgi:hypothetical protein
MLGLSKKEPQVKDTSNKKQDKQATSTSQSDEAKAILAKMEAKKVSGDCPFC